MQSERIWDERDKVKDMCAKMAKGHKGAFMVVGELYFDDWSHVVLLDLLGCYGHRIWEFFNTVCHQNLSDMATILYLWENNVIPDTQIDQAIDMGYRIHTQPYVSKATHLFLPDGTKQEIKGS